MPSLLVNARLLRLWPRLASSAIAFALHTVAPAAVSTAFADETEENAAPGAAESESAAAPEGLPSNGQLSDATIDDADPSAAVPAPAQQMKNPVQFGYLLMDLSDRADRAYTAKDFDRAARYYKAIIKAAPQKSVGYSKVCLSYMGMNDLEKAREFCHEALFHEGVAPLDFLRFLHLLLDTKKQFGPDEVAQADDVFSHLKEQKIDAQEVYQLQCDVALRVSDAKRMEECTKALAARWPDDPKTITYQWSFAVYKKDFATAEKLVQHAKTSAMPPEGVAKMEAATRAAQHRARPKYLFLAVGALALVLVGAMALRVLKQTRERSA